MVNDFKVCHFKEYVEFGSPHVHFPYYTLTLMWIMLHSSVKDKNFKIMYLFSQICIYLYFLVFYASIVSTS